MESGQPTPENQAVETNNLPTILDVASGALLIGGSVASLLTQQVAAAALPISAAVALNMFNRRQLLSQMQQAQNAGMAQVSSLVYELESNVAGDMEILRQEITANLQNHRQIQQNEINTLTASLDNLHASHGHLSQSHQELRQNHQQWQTFSQDLEAQLKKIEEVVGELHQIDNYTQSLRSHPDAAEMFYRRGFSHQRLGDKEEAIADYTEALTLDPTHAKAYHNRGILLAELGKKQKAAEDVRLAAKYYLEQGDIDSYDQARLLSKELYAVGSHESEPQLILPEMVENMAEELENPAPNIVTLGGLFN